MVERRIRLITFTRTADDGDLGMDLTVHDGAPNTRKKLTCRTQACDHTPFFRLLTLTYWSPCD